MDDKKVNTTPWILSGIAFFAGSIWLASSFSTLKPEPKSSELTSPQAFKICLEAIQGVVKAPSKAEIPYVKDYGDEKEAYFAWGANTKKMMLMNGLGLMAPSTGSCVVSKSTNTIITLTIDGKSII